MTVQFCVPTTFGRDSGGSTVSTRTSTTVASYHTSCSLRSTTSITHVESRRLVIVNETPKGASDDPVIREGSQIEEIEGAEDISVNDDSPVRGTYQFDNCHVYMNSFNTRGVKVKNSGNHAPRVTHLGGTAPDEGPSSSKLSRLNTQLNAPGFGQSSNRLEDFPHDSTFGLPPSLLFQLREDSLSYASDNSPSGSPVSIDRPFPKFEQKQPTKKDKLPATVDTKLMQSNPAPTILPGPESQPHPFLTINMGLHPNFLSHTLQPFPDDAPNNNTANKWNDLPSSTTLHPHHYPATPKSSRHRPDTSTSSKSLDHHLDSALAILIQSSGILAEGVTPQARNTLKAINALVSMETPNHDPPPRRFKSVRKVAKWLQFSRSPK